MIRKVLRFINNNEMLNTGDKVLVGVSGGADSICLLFVLSKLRKELGIDVSVLHVNHMIRGSEADEDEQYVLNMCRNWEVSDYESVSCDVVELARKQHLSTEEAGRGLRYQLFDQYAAKWNCNKIAVAHHRDDSVETILLNLFRGSGFKGLSGIDVIRGNIIRPLLCVGRDEIESFLRENDVAFRVDSTNLTEDYTRNKIRNRLLPYIKQEINPQAAEHILTAGNFMRDAQEYLDMESEKLFQQYTVKKEKMVILNLECCMHAPKLLKSYVYRRCLAQICDTLKDITYTNIETVHKLSDGPTGKKIDLPYGITVRKNYNELVFCQEDKSGIKDKAKGQDQSGIIKKNKCGERKYEQDLIPPCKLVTEGDGMVVECSVHNYKKTEIIPTKPYTKWFDYDKIKFTLRIRHRKSGDYLIVNSSGGRKKLKDYFIDEKIDKNSRDDIWLLADGSEIIWVIGYRISEAYKVTESTGHILQITVYGGRND